MTKVNHPDSHELRDWALYGPKDPEISELVDRLALEHGLRLHEIENLILQTLKDWIALETARQKLSSLSNLPEN